VSSAVHKISISPLHSTVLVHIPVPVIRYLLWHSRTHLGKRLQSCRFGLCTCSSLSRTSLGSEKQHTNWTLV